MRTWSRIMSLIFLASVLINRPFMLHLTIDCSYYTAILLSSLQRLQGFSVHWDFLVFSYANALDDKHFSSNAGDAMRGRGGTKYRENESGRSLCQISHAICTKGTISVPSVNTYQGDGRATFHYEIIISIDGMGILY